MRDSRAPCPPTESMRAAQHMVGTAYERLRHVETKCQRLCPPYNSHSGSGSPRSPWEGSRPSRLFLPRRYPLAQIEESLPRIGRQKAQPLAQIVDAKMIGTHAFRQLLPGERRRDRRLLARARGIGCDRRRATAVAEIVDEDASVPRTLRHGGDIALRIVLAHRLRNRSGECLGRVPIEARSDRHHDMQALAARGLHEAFKLHLLEPLPHLACRLDDGGPDNILARIE